MLDRRAFSAPHRERLLELAGDADCGGELGRVAEAAFPEPWGAATVLELVRAENWRDLMTISREARAVWERRQDRVTWLRVLGKRVLRRAAKRVPARRR